MDELHLEWTIKVGQRYEDWYGRYFRVYALEPSADPWYSQVHVIFTNAQGVDVPRKDPQVMEARQVAGLCRIQDVLS